MDLKRRYIEQKYAARRRAIPWRLSFAQWLEVWQRSGKLYKRGHAHGQYVMGRYGDVGAYEVGNVSIISNYENNAPGRQALIRAARRTNAEATAAQRAARAKGQAACVEANTGAKRSAEAKARMRAAAKARWARVSYEDRLAATAVGRAARTGMKDSDEVKAKRNAAIRKP